MVYRPSSLAGSSLTLIGKWLMTSWYGFCHDVFIKHSIDNPVKFNIGLVKSELQIDESIFGKKRKYHRGKNFKRFWVFGISNPDEHQIHIEIAFSRDRDTLEKIILDHVVPTQDVTIASDGWPTYHQFENIGFKHQVVTHDREFVNQDGFHTNSIKSVWSQMKNWVSSMHGLKHEWYNSYMAEFMFRYNYGGSYRGNIIDNLWKKLQSKTSVKW